MKKLTPLVLIAAFGALMFGSCKKDRTCTCTQDGEQLYEITWPKISKKDAKTACDLLSSNTWSGADCSLK
jgi:hypothetical protein